VYGLVGRPQTHSWLVPSIRAPRVLLYDGNTTAGVKTTIGSEDEKRSLVLPGLLAVRLTWLCWYSLRTPARSFPVGAWIRSTSAMPTRASCELAFIEVEPVTKVPLLRAHREVPPSTPKNAPEA
jgi:hypothetical protein